MKIERDIVLYGGSIAAVGVAFGIASALQHLSVRPPVILIYLPAVALSFWYGRQRSGILAFALSTVCLFCNFFWAEHRWGHVILYDAPIICLYIVYVWGIQNFAKSRHRLECVSQRNRQGLEAVVDARTEELMRVNVEYKAILDAAPFGIVLFGRDRIVERCNPAYEE